MTKYINARFVLSRLAVASTFLWVLLDLFSCSDKDITLPIEVVENIIGSRLDTLPISTSVVLMDSVNTTFNNPSGGQILVGRIQEKDFGITVASGHFNLAPTVLPDNIFTSTSTFFDSVEMIFDFGSYRLGDSTNTQEFSIFELSDSIRLGTSAAPYIYYQFDQIDPLPNEIGRFSFPATQFDTVSVDTSFTVNASGDTTGSTINVDKNPRVTLSAAFGQKIFDLRNASATGPFSSQSAFAQNIVRGIKIIPTSPDNELVLSIIPQELRIYYTHPIGSRVYTMSFGRTFTGIESNFTNSAFPADWQRGEEIPTEDLNDVAYVQSLTGIATKIRLPNIKAFLDSNNAVSNRISLVLNPTQQSLNAEVSPLASLELYRARDESYNLTAKDVIIANSFNTATLAQIRASLASSSIPNLVPLSSLYNENGHAYQDMLLTFYFDPIIKGDTENLPLFILPIGSNNNTLNGTKIGTLGYEQGQNMSLLIHYTIFE